MLTGGGVAGGGCAVGVGLALGDVTAHTPGHGLAIPHRGHFRRPAVRAFALGVIVGALIGVDDRRIGHPLSRRAQAVRGLQRETEAYLVACGAAWVDPAHQDPVDEIRVVEVRLLAHLVGDGAEGLGLLAA